MARLRLSLVSRSNQRGLGKVSTNLFKISIEKNSVTVVYISVTSAVLPYSFPR